MLLPKRMEMAARRIIRAPPARESHPIQLIDFIIMIISSKIPLYKSKVIRKYIKVNLLTEIFILKRAEFVGG